MYKRSRKIDLATMVGSRYEMHFHTPGYTPWGIQMDFHLPRSPTPTMVARSIFRDRLYIYHALSHGIVWDCMGYTVIQLIQRIHLYTSPYIIQLYTAFIQLIHYTSLSTPPQAQPAFGGTYGEGRSCRNLREQQNLRSTAVQPRC